MKNSITAKKLAKISQNDIPENVTIDRSADLESLFEENIKCMYWIENHLVMSLPKMVTAAGTGELQNAFQQHLEVTKGQVSRLEKIFELMGKPALPKKSDALEGLTMDGEHIIEETTAGSDARNTGLIMAGQLVENYEITAYTGLVKLATRLELNDISNLLSENLSEEEEADRQLSALAE